MVDDLKKGYYLLFIDGGKRANEQGQAEGAIGSFSRNPIVARCWPEGPRKLAAEKGLPYIAAFSDSATVVNQVTGGWNKNERATELYEEVEEALKRFKSWRLSWVPREMNRAADKLVDKAFKGEPVTHATD